MAGKRWVEGRRGFGVVASERRLRNGERRWVNGWDDGGMLADGAR